MKAVTYLLLFYFALGALMPRCDFSQLLTVNNLLQHFETHQLEAQSEGQALSFVNFLYIHFVEGDQHQHNSPAEHQNLPMQNISSTLTLHHFSALSLPQGLTSLDIRVALPDYQGALPAGVRQAIFHPPIFA